MLAQMLQHENLGQVYSPAPTTLDTNPIEQTHEKVHYRAFVSGMILLADERDKYA